MGPSPYTASSGLVAACTSSALRAPSDAIASSCKRTLGCDDDASDTAAKFLRVEAGSRNVNPVGGGYATVLGCTDSDVAAVVAAAAEAKEAAYILAVMQPEARSWIAMFEALAVRTLGQHVPCSVGCFDRELWVRLAEFERRLHLSVPSAATLTTRSMLVLAAADAADAADAGTATPGWYHPTDEELISWRTAVFAALVRGLPDVASVVVGDPLASQAATARVTRLAKTAQLTTMVWSELRGMHPLPPPRRELQVELIPKLQTCSVSVQEGVLRAFEMVLAEYSHLVITAHRGGSLDEDDDPDRYDTRNLDDWKQIVYVMKRRVDELMIGVCRDLRDNKIDHADHERIVMLCDRLSPAVLLAPLRKSCPYLQAFLERYLSERGLPCDAAPSPYGWVERMTIYKDCLFRDTDAGPHMLSRRFDATLLCTINAHAIGMVMYSDVCVGPQAGQAREPAANPRACIESATSCAFYTSVRHRMRLLAPTAFPGIFPSVGDAILAFTRQRLESMDDRKLYVSPPLHADKWRAKLALQPHIVMSRFDGEPGAQSALPDAGAADTAGSETVTVAVTAEAVAIAADATSTVAVAADATETVAVAVTADVTASETAAAQAVATTDSMSDAASQPDAHKATSSTPTCGAEDCEICSGRMWEQFCAHESRETTRLIRNCNARHANAMLKCDAFGFCPLTLDAKAGRAISVQMLKCGDPLYHFLCKDGSSFYTHEVEVDQEA